MMMEGVIPFLQYHDEELTLVKIQHGERDRVEDIINSSMDKVNDALQLNVEISVDVQFGKTYADVH
jgi:DNA polymerase I-like protein with 3'-5' exonuclease and polymerase domains